MQLPEELLYSETHEWLKIEDGVATIGITDYAQGELGDIVYIELPEVGDSFEPGQTFGSIEAVKTVSDLYLSIGGEVVEVNGNLNDSPELINNDPYGDGWIVKIKIADGADTGSLWNAETYKNSIA